MEALGGGEEYSSHSFTTSALDGGEWSASRPGHALPPVPIVQEAGWAPEPVWTQEDRGKILCPCRGSNPDRPVVQPVVRHYTAWANPAPNIRYCTVFWNDTDQKVTLTFACQNGRLYHMKCLFFGRMDLYCTIKLWHSCLRTPCVYYNFELMLASETFISIIEISLC
jgi:hypothetical protein